MLARDSIIYFIVIFGLCASIGVSLALTLTVRYLLVYLIWDILSDVVELITIGPST
jgi:hypothetical protein